MPEMPVFCRDCHGQNTWQRLPERDILSESGVLMWERYRCKVCGAETILPVEKGGKSWVMKNL
jgi:hypothetical protein